MLEYLKKISHSCVTPFELGKDEIDNDLVLSAKEEEHLAFWKEMVSKKGADLEFQKYIEALDIEEDQLKKMLSSNIANKTAQFEWTIFLSYVLKNTKKASDFPSENIPFGHLFYPFANTYLELLVPHLDAIKKIEWSKDLLRQLKSLLIRKIAKVAELVLLQEFKAFKENFIENDYKELNRGLEKESQEKYCAFVNFHLEDKFFTLFSAYPMMARNIGTITKQFLDFTIKLTKRLQQDKEKIESSFGIKVGSLKQIEVDLGDQHNGESTSILVFQNAQKIVYKPGCSNSSIVYNNLISWVNKKLEEELVTFKVVANKDYAWLSFIEHKPCHSKAEVNAFYNRAGILLGIVYFLNGNDFHFENVIAHGSSPVLIDHETIIGPHISRKSTEAVNEDSPDTWKQLDDSILKTNLLPLPDNKLPPSLAGFRTHTEKLSFSYLPKIVRINTDAMTRLVQLKTPSTYGKNIPYFQDKPQVLSKYKAPFLEGFYRLYDLIISNKAFLTGKSSPIMGFKSSTIRLIWRSTKIYFNILKNLQQPQYLRNSVKYGLRLELLARAYLKDLSFIGILAMERKQMLDGNIPIFRTHALSNGISLDDRENLKIFDKNCLTSIIDKIKAASWKDYEKQKSTISDSINLFKTKKL